MGSEGAERGSLFRGSATSIFPAPLLVPLGSMKSSKPANFDFHLRRAMTSWQMGQKSKRDAKVVLRSG